MTPLPSVLVTHASFKIGRRVVYRAGDVEAWLGQLRRKASGDAS